MMGMYSLEQVSRDGDLWQLIAFRAGTGGSIFWSMISRGYSTCKYGGRRHYVSTAVLNFAVDVLRRFGNSSKV